MLYRNDDNGDVFDTADVDKETVKDVSSRGNWHKVTKADAERPFHEWAPSVRDRNPVDAPKVVSAMDNDLLPENQTQGPVDVEQDGPAGSKAVDSPKKAAPGEKADAKGEGTGERKPGGSEDVSDPAEKTEK